jgi:hypothetical protein
VEERWGAVEMHSISRKAVAVQMGSILSIALRKRNGFTAHGALMNFRRWLGKHGSAQEQEMIEGYAFGILADTERRIKLVRVMMEKEIFFRTERGEHGTRDTEKRKSDVGVVRRGGGRESGCEYGNNQTSRVRTRAVTRGVQRVADHCGRWS